ncbi:hypothetical protein M2260_004458 [Rhodococcus erythropolis]|uniref:hypothetical protein n=1 Tax=Rhodococcus erythropolis TaxID=1833 RepID=UPI002226FFFB|nr:hypothetical protein [Rhodococcus erythropolis]MCW2429550.1 hypothetical protein [Rhodococcus erythropolis]
MFADDNVSKPRTTTTYRNRDHTTIDGARHIRERDRHRSLGRYRAPDNTEITHRLRRQRLTDDEPQRTQQLADTAPANTDNIVGTKYTDQRKNLMTVAWPTTAPTANGKKNPHNDTSNVVAVFCKYTSQSEHTDPASTI